MKDSGVQLTKHVYMALINGYAASGQFEKAKQVHNECSINLLWTYFFLFFMLNPLLDP